MRWDNIYLAGTGLYLPEQQYTAEQAVADGAYDASAAETNGIRAVRVANDDEAGVVMAAAAGRQAMSRSGHDSQDIDLVLHGYVSHQGREMWSPAHYVQQETVGGGPSVTIEMRQGCNGLLAALELGASYLAARPDTTAALLTAGDAFRLPYIDRWKSDDQTIFGDAGSALVLSKRQGFARLLAGQRQWPAVMAGSSSTSCATPRPTTGPRWSRPRYGNSPAGCCGSTRR
ncbi:MULTISPECIES: ketoacyl-ACP synthase III family protein [unclassified Micromonospora]|uniref:ketoacyl-ACP synthase III family protein n=1 Tax=unclassified Micromonospora TaxID=2617518 RepID=UPI003A87B36A